MPPPHHIISPSLRGFVCRSCLSKLYISQRRPPWLTRSLRTVTAPPRTKKHKQDNSHPRERIESRGPIESSIRYFDETPDGDRREVSNEKDEEAFMDSLASQFGFGESEKRYLRSMGDNPPVDEDYDVEKELQNATEGRVYEDEDTRGITTQTDRLDALITGLDDITKDESLSHEEKRSQVRALLFDDKKGIKGINRGIATGEAMTFGPRDGIEKRAPALLDAHPEAGKTTLSSKFPQKGSDPGSLDIKLNLKDFPRSYQRHINTLQQSLFNASGSLEHKIRPAATFVKSIWSPYLMCRSALMAQPEKVPLGIWSGLWIVLSSIDSSEYVDRMAHIKYLGDDICKVGIQMDVKQRLLYVESVLAQGETSVAAELWEEFGIQIQSEDPTGKEYVKLGINIFCRQGRIDKALQLASMLLKDTQKVADYRVLLPIIQACLGSQNETGIQMGWALYIRLKFKLGPAMSMDDYDIITLSFLEADQQTLALAAFRDMMLRPDMPAEQDSTSLYTALTNDQESLGSIQISSKELAHHSAAAMSVLPMAFNNKYFFGSWIKKLIGDGQLDGALKVFHLASDMGIRPDAKHVNGIIGAFFRHGTGNSVSIGERLAWRIINNRLEFVRSRKNPPQFDGVLRAIPTNSPDKSDVQRVGFVRDVATRATIETFCILIHSYRSRQKQEALLKLFDTLREAEIPPNGDFMNELLNMDARSHKRAWAWNTYLSMTRSGNVRPNYETFRVLFGLVCQSLDRLTGVRNESKFVSPQELFAEMMDHKESLWKRGVVPRNVYNEIIRAFSLAEDQAGTAVAMRALHYHFGRLPNEQTARSVLLQLTRFGQRNVVGYKSRRLNLGNRATQERLAYVKAILQRFTSERAEALFEEEGIKQEDLTEEQKLGEAAIVLSDLLRHAFRTHYASEVMYMDYDREMSRKVATAMGVPECCPWENVAVVE